VELSKIDFTNYDRIDESSATSDDEENGNQQLKQKPKKVKFDDDDNDIDVIIDKQYESKLRNPFSYHQPKEALPIRSSLTGEWKKKKKRRIGRI